MALVKKQKQLIRYTYDFSRDGGAIGSISLTPDAVSIGNDFVISDCIVHVETGLASGGTPTVTIGNTNDVDGYMADIWSLAQSDGAVIVAGEVAGAKLWDDTNDHMLAFNVKSDADNQDVILEVGTAALTAGKLSVYLEVMPLY